jgi:monothiol glutaredoxin
MDEATKTKIESALERSRVVLFMKGSKHFPQCGFSAKVVQILKHSGVEEFHDVNILADPDVRQGLKEYSNWPTFPQLYVDRKFVGGCDIVTDLFENGELEKLLGSKSS